MKMAAFAEQLFLRIRPTRSRTAFFVRRTDTFGALPLALLQIGQVQLGDAELVGLRAATNELRRMSLPFMLNRAK